jgi:hypothetical protein
MTPEAKFRDPEIHYLNFGDLSDTGCQVQDAIEFSPKQNAGTKTFTEVIFFAEARGAHVRGDRGRAMSAPRQCCRSRQKWPWVDG